MSSVSLLTHIDNTGRRAAVVEVDILSEIVQDVAKAHIQAQALDILEQKRNTPAQVTVDSEGIGQYVPMQDGDSTDTTDDLNLEMPDFLGCKLEEVPAFVSVEHAEAETEPETETETNELNFEDIFEDPEYVN